VWLDLNLVDDHVHRGRPASRVSQLLTGQLLIASRKIPWQVIPHTDGRR
jgi:hypothetical protein